MSQIPKPKCKECDMHIEDNSHGKGERKRHECNFTGEKRKLMGLEMQPSPSWCPKRSEIHTELVKIKKEKPAKPEAKTEPASFAPVEKNPVGKLIIPKEKPLPEGVSYEYKIQCYSKTREAYLNVGVTSSCTDIGVARQRLNEWKRRYHRIYANSYDGKEFDLDMTRIIKRKKIVKYGDWEAVE